MWAPFWAHTVARHSMYTLMDGYSGYNQIMIAFENQLQTFFITMYEAFAYRVMPFGLMCAPTIFRKGMMKIFAYYLDKFVKVFLMIHGIWSQRRLL